MQAEQNHCLSLEIEKKQEKQQLNESVVIPILSGDCVALSMLRLCVRTGAVYCCKTFRLTSALQSVAAATEG